MMSPPNAVVDYLFSYSRTNKKMRFKLDSNEWLVDKIVGQWEFKDGHKKTGNWTVRCQLVIKDNTAYVYVPGSSLPYNTNPNNTCTQEVARNHEQCIISTDHPFPQGRNSHWRLCYARELAEKGDEAPWRLRDERTGELWFVKDYKGLVNVNYLDKGSHVFVDGPVEVKDGVARF